MATKLRFNRFSGFPVVRHVAGDKVRVKPSFGDWVSAYHIHRRFAWRLGAQHIATTRALACLSAVVRRHRPKTVLEFGAGIGTLTYLLLSGRDPRLSVVALETNPFCLAQLERNIPEEFKPRLTVIAAGGPVPDIHFDLIVVDGRLSAMSDWAATRNGPFRRRRSRISVLQADADRSDKEPRLRSRQAIFWGIEFGSSENAIWFLRSNLQAKEDVASWCDGVSQFAREAMDQAGLGNALGHTRERTHEKQNDARSHEGCSKEQTDSNEDPQRCCTGND